MTHAPDIALARTVLATQPFSALLGARIARFGDGAAELVLDLGPDHRQQHGYAHGGVLAYLADNAATFAAGSLLGAEVLTAGLTIEYVRPARQGPLRAVATVDAATTRNAVCRVEIHGPGGTCALAQARVTQR